MFSIDDRIAYGNVLPLGSTGNEQGWTLRFTPSAHGGSERLWFNARIRNEGGRPGMPLCLILEEAHQLLGGGGQEPFRPVWRADGRNWERLAPGERIVSAEGRVDFVWTVPAPVVEGQLAVCMPYGEPELRDTLALATDYWQCVRFGTTALDRPLLRVTNRIDSDNITRPGLFCSARIHSGEAPGSWVLDGLMRHFAQQRVDDVLLWVIPFVDRDGVDRGDYGKDHWPRDFNRAWTQVQTYRHEVAQIQRDQRFWQKVCKPSLALDWHSPGLQDTKPHVHDISGEREPFSDALAEAFGTSHANFRRAPTYMNKLFEELGMQGGGPCASVYYRNKFAIASLTMEVPYMLIGDRTLLADDYREIGARIAEVCLRRIRST